MSASWRGRASSLNLSATVVEERIRRLGNLRDEGFLAWCKVRSTVVLHTETRARSPADDLSEGELGIYMKQTNDIFDHILDSVSRSEELDPFQLPEMVSSFERKILFRFHGEARIYNGTITGLSTMHRAGDSHLKMDESNLEVLADVGVGALDVNCKAHVKFMGRGPTVNIAVHIAYARILLEAFQ
ncbi:unnamed protein product [Ixodes persulcatus]